MSGFVKKSLLPLIQCLVLVFVLGLTALSSTPSKSEMFSWWTTVFPPDRLSQTTLEGQARHLASMLEIVPKASFHQKVDSARQFIHGHSIHKVDKEFYTYWYNIPVLMTMMAAHAQEPDKHQPPHAECSSRTAVMYWLLKGLDVRSRIVVIYPAEDLIEDLIEGTHTYLEVHNPQTEKWEIQDPHYNMYWVFSETGERASTEDMLTYPIEETFLPCISPDDCSYSSPERHVRTILNRFALASIIDIDTNNHPLILNPDRFNPDHPFIVNHPRLPYCQLFADTCYQDIIELGISQHGL